MSRILITHWPQMENEGKDKNICRKSTVLLEHCIEFYIPDLLCLHVKELTHIQNFCYVIWGFTVVKIVILFSVFIPCSVMVEYQHSVGPYCLHLQPWGWKQHHPQKCWFPTTTLHCVTTQKTTNITSSPKMLHSPNFWYICGLILVQQRWKTEGTIKCNVKCHNKHVVGNVVPTVRCSQWKPVATCDAVEDCFDDNGSGIYTRCSSLSPFYIAHFFWRQNKLQRSITLLHTEAYNWNHTTSSTMVNQCQTVLNQSSIERYQSFSWITNKTSQLIGQNRPHKKIKSKPDSTKIYNIHPQSPNTMSTHYSHQIMYHLPFFVGLGMILAFLFGMSPPFIIDAGKFG